MKLENLSVGMIAKNYPELCKILNVPKKTGGAKENQLEWFSEYFSWYKKGNKFVITEVLDIPVEPMADKRGGDMSDNTYVEYIEKLILDTLVQDGEKGEIFFSKSQLYKRLEMVNANYSPCSGRIPKLAKFIDTDINNVQDFYNSTNGMLERNLNKALKSLESQSLIFWTKEIALCKVNPILATTQVTKETKVDKFGEETERYSAAVATGKEYREATDAEKRYIITIERETLKELNCKNKQEVIQRNKWKEFNDKVKNVLFEEQNIAFYWQSYKIIFNTAHVQERKNELDRIMLSNQERDEYKAKLNKSIVERSNRNTKNRHIKAQDSIENLFGIPSNKIERRLDRTYISDGEYLAKTLIEKEHKNIVQEVKRTLLN